MAQYEKLVDGKPDLVYVLSGGVSFYDSGQKVKPAPYSASDNSGFLSGGKARVIASVELAKFFPDATIVTSSTDKKPDGTMEKHSEIYREELRKFGIPDKRLVEQVKSSTTFGELVELVKILASKKYRHVVVITNAYHIPRTFLLYEKLSLLIDEEKDPEFHKDLTFLREGGIKIKFIAAEEILKLRSPHYQNMVLDKLPETPEYARRLESELNGIQDILEGRYQIKYPI